MVYSLVKMFLLQIVIQMRIALDTQTLVFQITVSVDRMRDAQEEMTALEKLTPANLVIVNVVRMMNVPNMDFVSLENAKVYFCQSGNIFQLSVE